MNVESLKPSWLTPTTPNSLQMTRLSKRGNPLLSLKDFYVGLGQIWCHEKMSSGSFWEDFHYYKNETEGEVSPSLPLDAIEP